MTGAFTVLRPVLVEGRRYDRGSTVTTNDAQLIGMLLSAGQIEPANARTAAAIRSKAVVSWSRGVPAELPPERDPWIRRA
jgi:hypothetical protein